MPQCSLCGVNYPPDRQSHFAIPCMRCQAAHPCPNCDNPIGLYCFLTDKKEKFYFITIAHAVPGDPVPTCEIKSGPGTLWLPQVHVYEPGGTLSGPEDGKHQYITFDERPEFDEWSENGDEPCDSLMQWSAQTVTPCGKGKSEDVAGQT